MNLNNFVKVILSLLFIIVVGVVCFFLGRKVENDSYSSNNVNQTTITQNTINENKENLESNTSIENETFNDLTNAVNINE